jgi:tetratricopeptide (TPR) repeat protein
MSSRSLASAVFVAALVTFAGTVGYSYVWDDPYLVTRVKSALANGDISQLFTTSFYVKTMSSARYYRPVMLATLLGEISLTGGAPWFSHLINVLIHALNSTLVYLLLRKTLRHGTGALAGAILFAVHPVHAETVAAVFNRMDLLALTLLLPVAILWTPLGAEPVPVSPLVRVSAMASFFLACLTKETAFMLPVVLLGLEILRSKRPERASAINLLSIASVSGAALLLRWAVFAREGATGAAGVIRAGALLPDADFFKILKILLVNMRLAVLPFPFRSQWAESDLYLEWPTTLAAVFFVFLVVLAFRRCPRVAGPGMLWWSIFTLPVLGFFNIGQVAAAERYAYIPSVGVVLIVGGLVASLPGEVLNRKLVKYAALAGMLVLGTAAGLHTRALKNDITLFQKLTGTNPNFASVHLNLGAALARKGRFEEALLSYENAAALVPGWSDVAFNRGNVFYRMGRYEEALKDYQSVLKNDPGDWEAELNMGNVYAAMGRTGEAAEAYRRSANINGSSGKPLVGLGVLAARSGDFMKAVGLFTGATRAEPGLAEAYEGLGESYLALGMQGMAEGAFFKALEISPGNTRAAVKLGRFLSGTGRPVQAVHAFQAALAADPSLFEAWMGLIAALDAAGEEARADDLIRELGRDDPRLARRVMSSRKRGPSSPAGK